MKMHGFNLKTIINNIKIIVSSMNIKLKLYKKYNKKFTSN